MQPKPLPFSLPTLKCCTSAVCSAPLIAYFIKTCKGEGAAEEAQLPLVNADITEPVHQSNIL